MNKGTIIRIASIAIAVLASLVCMFDIVALPMWAKIIIAVGLLVSCTIATYFNNDFSEEACVATGMARQMKAEKKSNYVGERFYDIPSEEFDIEEE